MLNKFVDEKGYLVRNPSDKVISDAVVKMKGVVVHLLVFIIKALANLWEKIGGKNFDIVTIFLILLCLPMTFHYF